MREAHGGAVLCGVAQRIAQPLFYSFEQLQVSPALVLVNVAGRTGWFQWLGFFAALSVAVYFQGHGLTACRRIGFGLSLGKKQGELVEEVGVGAEEARDLRVDEVDGAVDHLVPVEEWAFNTQKQC